MSRATPPAGTEEVRNAQPGERKQFDSTHSDLTLGSSVVDRCRVALAATQWPPIVNDSNVSFDLATWAARMHPFLRKVKGSKKRAADSEPQRIEAQGDSV